MMAAAIRKMLLDADLGGAITPPRKAIPPNIGEQASPSLVPLRMTPLLARSCDIRMTTTRCCCGRTSPGQVRSGLMPSAGARGPDAAVRAKRQSMAVLAAVVSVAVGAVFLRFLRARGETQSCEEIGRSGIAAAQHCGADRESPDPPSPRVLLGRIEDNFATGYQTITAIIQGVALVVLVTTSASAVFGTTSSSQIATAVSQAVAVLVIIIITTDQFFQLTAATRWLPSTIDTAIPYLIGAGEATAALSLGDNTRWCRDTAKS
jgi:hypothetical protein